MRNLSHSPMDRKELIALVRQLHQTATPWIPSGLGTRLDWGAPIRADHPTVSCRGLNRVIDHAIDDLTITVEAGLPLQELQSMLAEQGQWLPIDWPWGGEPSGSIGGLVARGMAGGLRQRHLGVRDQIIGIGLLRSDGIEAHAGGRVVKNVAGYDLMRLLCGSWGSLALITEVTLRVQPMRPSHGAVTLNGPMDGQERCRAELLKSSLTPERCDWIHSDGRETQLRVLVSSVSDAAVETQLSRIESMAEHQGLSVERHSDMQPLDSPLPMAGGRWLVRVMVPPARLHALLSSNEYQALHGWSWCLAAGAGIGDGWAADNDNMAAHGVDALRQRLRKLGGQLMVLRQPDTGSQRLPAWGNAPAKAVIESVKRQFDPQQQLCRGRLPGVEA